MNRTFSHFEASRRAGFALIATLSVMVLLVMVSMGVMSLSTSQIRVIKSDGLRLAAQANARLALMMALGELQKAAGPDRRITANASVLGDSAEQPQLLGVWESFKQANTDSTSISYDSQKKNDFVVWLSSGALEDRLDQDYATRMVSDPVMLVRSATGEGGVGDVLAESLKISNEDGVAGRYAWHVFDESQKANITMQDPVPQNDAERISSLASTGKSDFESLAGLNNDFDHLISISEQNLQKMYSLESSELIEGAVRSDITQSNAFQVLSVHSKSLLVDVINGGYMKDLSLLFEGDSLPPSYTSRHIYSEASDPVAPAPKRFTGAEPIPSPDPTWSLLYSHYKLYNQLEESGGVLSIPASYVEREEDSGYFDQQQLLPVVANSQFIYSLSAHKFNWENNSNMAPHQGYLGFWTDVIITLWNPYNVELRLDKMEIEFFRFPLQLELFRQNATEGLVPCTYDPVHLGTMNVYPWQQSALIFGEVDVQDKLPTRARLLPNVGNAEIVLKPGEYKVFGRTSIRSGNAKYQYYTAGIELREGFDVLDGGIYTRDIAKNADGNAVGRWAPGETQSGQSNHAGSIAWAFDDVYSVKVSPERLDRSDEMWPETNQQEVSAYMKVYRGDGGSYLFNGYASADLEGFQNLLDTNRTQVGAVEIDMDSVTLATKLDTSEATDLATLVCNEQDIRSELAQYPLGLKQPFLIASLRLKSEKINPDPDDLAKNPASPVWLHNGITNQYFTSGIKDDDGNSVDQLEDDRSHQYEFTWQPMTSWSDIPSVEVDDKSRGYGATGVTSNDGVNVAPFAQIPLMPATSLAQFVHAPLNSGGQAPLTTQIVGNSFAPLIIDSEKKEANGSLGAHLDHSYMANNSLFDSYFLSTVHTEEGPAYGGSGRSLNQVVRDFFSESRRLRNVKYEAATATVPSVSKDDYESFAQYLYNKGAFNVNSTSKEAWALFLGSGADQALPILDQLSSSSSLSTVNSNDGIVVSRFTPLLGQEVDAGAAAQSAADSTRQSRWLGHRKLSTEQIQILAEKVVDEVKLRGPFQSVAEFVNRRLSDDQLSNSGALQAAIEQSKINVPSGTAAPKHESELSLGGGSGFTSDGAATQVTQADVLTRIAPSITVRGDTFTVRAYGEASDDKRTARAWCEAVVQRDHAFVDASQDPTTKTEDLNVSNKEYGRRFVLVSFRWLSEFEL